MLSHKQPNDTEVILYCYLKVYYGKNCCHFPWWQTMKGLRNLLTNLAQYPLGIIFTQPSSFGITNVSVRVMLCFKQSVELLHQYSADIQWLQTRKAPKFLKNDLVWNHFVISHNSLKQENWWDRDARCQIQTLPTN